MSLLVVKFQIENVKVGGETSRWMASEIISVVKVVTYSLIKPSPAGLPKKFFLKIEVTFRLHLTSTWSPSLSIIVWTRDCHKKKSISNFSNIVIEADIVNNLREACQSGCLPVTRNSFLISVDAVIQRYCVRCVGHPIFFRTIPHFVVLKPFHCFFSGVGRCGIHVEDDIFDTIAVEFGSVDFNHFGQYLVDKDLSADSTSIS